MQRVGNVVIDGVPAGGEDDYVVLREVGELPAFDFEPRDHLEIGELLDAIDMAARREGLGRALLTTSRASAPASSSRS